MGLSSRQPERPARHFVNMVSIRTLPEDNTASTNSSTGFVPTDVLRPEDDDYDLDLPPYPPGFSRFPVFPPRRGHLVFNVSNDERSSMEKPMSKDSSANSATLIGLSNEQMRSNASWSQITLMMPLMWLGTSKYSRHQALM